MVGLLLCFGVDRQLLIDVDGEGLMLAASVDDEQVSLRFLH